MTTTCDHHKERGLNRPFWDRCQSDFAHARHIEEQVEGHVTKLKLIKRQGYGRASFPLLRKRVLHV